MAESINTSETIRPFDEVRFVEEQGLKIISATPVEAYRIKDEVLGLFEPGDFDTQFQDDVLQQCRRYLSTKIIADKFDADHSARRTWRQDMAALYGKPFIDFYQNDRMRGNRLFPLIMNMRSSLMILKRRAPIGPLKEAATNLLSEIPEIGDYGKMSLSEKRAIVSNTEAFVRRYLEMVCNRE